MPIKDPSRYPANWKEISLSIKIRAGWRCEGSPAYPGCRAEHGQPHPITGSRVIITVAHMNHDPSDCTEDNLKAMCQRCHLTYDAPLHARNAAATRRARKAVGELV